MSPSERLAIEAECERLCIAFSHLVDQRRYADLVALFTADGCFERFGKVHVGHAAIRRELETRSTDMVTRHLCTGTLFDTVDADKAESVTYFLVARQDGIEGQTPPYPLDGLDAVGELHDSFERTVQGWRIARRKVVAVFRRRRDGAGKRPAVDGTGD